MTRVPFYVPLILNLFIRFLLVKVCEKSLFANFSVRSICCNIILVSYVCDRGNSS